MSVWGVTIKTDGSRDEWIVITIDFAKILKNKCTLKDYDNWTPTVGGTSATDAKLNGCLLGEKLTYKVSNSSFGELAQLINVTEIYGVSLLGCLYPNFVAG